MLTFTAFDVIEGDAFLLEKDEKKILVDGGKDSRNNFVEKFSRTRIEQLDLIVCTHADADHTEGIINLLRSSVKLTCKEIWIPAKWQRYIDRIKDDRMKFILDLTQEIQSDSNVKSHVELVENIERTFESKTKDKLFEDSATIKGNFDSIAYCREIKECMDYVETSPKQFETYLLSQLEPVKIIKGLNNMSIIDGKLVLHLHDTYELTDSQFDDFRAALEKYGKLEALLDEVIKKKIKISWLELVEDPMTKEYFDAYDEQGLLTPLCHRKVATYTRKGLSESLLEMLPKHDPNKTSLVLASKETKKNPLIIFSSDSDFEKIEFVPSAENMLITVAHHGSESNKEAINKCINTSNGKNPIFIRGDSYRIRMSKAFIKSVRSLGKTYCTRCRRWNINSRGGTCSSDYQLISLSYNSGWKSVGNKKLTPCICENKLK